MLRSTLCVLTASRFASAEPVTLEGRQRELALADDVDGGPEVLRGFSMGAFAQVAGGSIEDKAASDVAAGAELYAKADGCDYVRIGGQGRIGWQQDGGAASTPQLPDGSQASAEQWASVCAPLPGTLIELGHQLEWDVRPSLLAPLGMRHGKNRRESFRLHWRAFRSSRAALETSSWPTPTTVKPLTPPPPGELLAFDIDTELSWLWSSGGDVAFRASPTVIGAGYTSPKVAPWGEDRPFLATLFHGGGQFNGTSSTLRMWIGNVENLALGPLFLSGGIGFASAGAGEFVTDTERELGVDTWRGKLEIEAGTANAHGYLKATNDLELAPDGYIVADRRLSSGAAFDVGRTRIALDGAFGRSRAYVLRVPTTGALVGGGSLSIIRELTQHLRASVQVEVAKSFYADDAMAQDFTARWGARAFGVLQAVARH
jgi:hypothetical protein